MLTVSANFLRSADSIWIHDLYIEALPAVANASAPTATPATTLFEIAGGDAWLTGNVLVGDRRGGSSRGVNVGGKGRVYARSAPLSLSCYTFTLRIQI